MTGWLDLGQDRFRRPYKFVSITEFVDTSATIKAEPADNIPQLSSDEQAALGGGKR